VIRRNKRLSLRPAWAPVIAASLLIPFSAIHAQVSEGAVTTLRLDGIEIDFDAAGEWVAMHSTSTQPVNFPDQRGIRDAYTIAEERGKAAIIRYFEESVTTGRLLQEISRESQNARRVQGSQGDSVTRDSERNMVTSISEFTRSFSSGTLRGVTVLERGYDSELEEVWVTVGFSRLTSRVAAHIQHDAANPQTPSVRQAPSSNPPGASAGIPRPQSSSASRGLPTTPSPSARPNSSSTIGPASDVGVVDVERRSRDGGIEEFTGSLFNGHLAPGAEVEVTLVAFGEDRREVGRTTTRVIVGREGSLQMFRVVLAPIAPIASYEWAATSVPDTEKEFES